MGSFVSRVDALFDSDVFKNTGFVARKEQREYARHIAEILESQNGLGFIEAATGTGKTFGYLFPMMLYMADGHTSDRMIIATFTRALQRQIINSDVVFVRRILGELGLPCPAVALKMGSQAFFSPSRVSAHVKSLVNDANATDKDKHLWLKFEQFAIDCAESGSGMWMDWFDAYQSLPPGVSVDDINIANTDDDDNPAYKQHNELAKEADLVITNYATLLNQNRNGILESDSSVHMLLCDEAHEINSACESFANHRYLMRSIYSDVSRASTLVSKRTMENTLSFLREWENELSTLDRGEAFLTDTNYSFLLNDQAKKAVDASKRIRRLRNSVEKVAQNSFDVDTLKLLDNVLDALKFFAKGSSGLRQRAIGYSDKRRLPSLASVSTRPGWLFGSVISTLNTRVALTSATISDARREVSFESLASELALFNRASMKVKLEPTNYGTMNFVLCDKAVAKPISGMDEDSAVYSTSWLKNTAAMIEAAVKRGTTLVLCSSFSEVSSLHAVLGDRDGWLYHEQGCSLMEFSRRFSMGGHPVLITPSAWEGVSFRHVSGKQLFNQLVITRIPFMPPNKLIDDLFIEDMGARNMDVNRAKAILYVKRQNKAVNKMRQGIGRGIRDSGDVITLHICDPRMPRYGEATGFINVIPNRFMSQYRLAETFGHEREPLIYL